MFLIVYIVMTVFLALLLYAWAVYPVIVRAVGRKRRPDTAAPTRLHVDIILAAHNEEAHLESRLQNLVDLDRGDLACRVAIHVGLDSCDDASEAIATAFAKNNGSVSVHRFPERRGKVAVLKDLVRATARDDEQGVILFTDANAAFDPGALARLLAPFGDPATGGVCGRLEFTDREGSTVPENFYWRWEKKLKEAESMVDSCLGANGAIYAIRRSLMTS
jgi:cellulose synthase/poly-beta-1,6-N-acetylglucosamine synthase-like glycosyltransferase